MRIYLATWLEDNQGETLTKVGASRRLLSYFFLKEAPPDFMKVYTETGVYKNTIKRDTKKGGSTNVKGKKKRTA